MTPDSASLPLHRLDFRLFWNECDPAGIVYFASWFLWMERTQNEWMLDHGLGPDTIHERFGGGFVVANATADYLSIARAFDLLSCEMRLLLLGAGSVTHGFAIAHRETGAAVATGRVTLAWVEGDRASALPDAVAGRWRDS